jgi:two-component system chemotaxis response regulator CheY
MFVFKPFTASGITPEKRTMAYILVVEDNEPVRKVLCALLEDAGHMTAEAANGEEAEDRLRNETFDLVVTDLYMPEKDGLALIRQIRRENPDLGIIAVSGGTESLVAQMTPSLTIAELLGCVAVFSKPIDPTPFLQTIDDFLSRQTPAPA